MKKYKEQWAILKDEKSAKVDKRTAAKEIIKLQEELVKLKPDFECVDLGMTVYSEFAPKDYKHSGKVKWGDVDSWESAEEYAIPLRVVQNCEALAVQITRELLPSEPVDSQKFGMIVSAKTEKILKAYYEEKKLYIREKSGK